MKPYLFQTDQVNCTCFSNSPKDRNKIFLSKNLSLNEKSQQQSLKKQQKYSQSSRNQSESSKNKKKSLKKQKPSNASQTSRNFRQQNDIRSTINNQQKQRQTIPMLNLESRRHSENQKESQHSRNISNYNNQKYEIKPQEYKNFNQSLGAYTNLIMPLQHKQQRSIRNIRQPQLNQINPFHQLQQFHFMDMNQNKNNSQQKNLTVVNDKKQMPTHSNSIIPTSNMFISFKDLPNQQSQSSVIQWKSQQEIVRENSCKRQPLNNQNFSTRVHQEQTPVFVNKKYQKSIQKATKAIQSQDHSNSIQNNFAYSNSKNSTRKQSINISRSHPEHEKNDQYEGGHLLNFEDIQNQQVNHSFSPVRNLNLNSFRGSKVSHREKESITKRLNQKRMLPKQIESVNDQNQQNLSQISQVVGRGWDNYQTQDEKNSNSEAIKNREQFKTLTLFTRESELNSKTNTKASQIKTGTEHSMFMTPKSQQMTKMYQFPLNQQGRGAYDLSYKNIQNLSQIKNKQSMMERYFQAEKLLQRSIEKDQHSASKNKKSRKSSLKYI